MNRLWRPTRPCQGKRTSCYMDFYPGYFLFPQVTDCTRCSWWRWPDGLSPSVGNTTSVNFMSPAGGDIIHVVELRRNNHRSGVMRNTKKLFNILDTPLHLGEAGVPPHEIHYTCVGFGVQEVP